MYSRNSNYNLRSHSAAPRVPTQYQPVNPGYQPPPAHHVPTSNQFAALDNDVSSAAATLESVLPMIDTAKPTTDFQITISNVLRILVGQMKEMKLEQHLLRQSIHQDFQCVANNFKQMDCDMLDMTRQVVKTEQYNRRDMITVVGLEKPAEETEQQLAAKVAEHLSSCGESVSPTDFTAIHRNGTESRQIRGKTFPPTITAKFKTISKKDAVLRKYRNFDSSKNKPRSVKIYQSLSHHYSELRRSITKFFDDENSSENRGKKLKWATYQSPSAGLAVKLKSDEYFKNIHVYDDFLTEFAKYV